MELVIPVGQAAALGPLAATVDNRGMTCAQGILRLLRVLRTAPPGGVVKVLSTDRAAEQDYPAWCRNTGHVFLGHVEEDDDRWGPLIVSFIRKRALSAGGDR